MSNALLALERRTVTIALAPMEALTAAGIDGSRRPETLAIAEFARLADVYVRRAVSCAIVCP